MTIRTAGRSRIHYTSARVGASADLTVDVGEALGLPDDLALFLTERYRLYTCFLGRLAMAPVEHEPWPLHRATLVGFQETVRQAADLPDGDAAALVPIPQAFTCALVRCVSRSALTTGTSSGRRETNGQNKR